MLGFWNKCFYIPFAKADPSKKLWSFFLLAFNDFVSLTLPRLATVILAPLCQLLAGFFSEVLRAAFFNFCN